MKIKKSVLSIILIICLFISSLVPSMVFADAPDISSAALRLQQLGIVDSTVTDMNRYLTREQLARAIVIAKDLTDEASTLSGSTIFPDIKSNSELSGYVNALLSRGLMYGMPDGYFHPEGGITYGEACVILVKLLGYTDSDVSGMWPNNYISKATDLKLTDKISLKKNEKITVGVAAVMLDRLLDTNVKKTTASEADKTFSEYVNLYTDIVVYDNASTYSSLASNAVLTDKGTFYLSNSEKVLQAGSTYRVSLDDNYIEKVFGEINESYNITVESIIDNTIYYSEDYTSKVMNLPSDITYYYHGAKQSYDTLKNVLKTNSTIVFAYNDSKTGYEYAVVIDPIYSKPEIAVNFDTNSDSLGSIELNPYITIMKNGKVITKTGIEEMDVVYSVTDVAGENKYIFVYDNKAEGSLKAFTANGSTPTGIQIDTKSYEFSKELNILTVSQFKEGDKVAALLGHDGKVVAVRKIDYKTGTKVEVKILGNFKTSDNLNSSEVLTDSGKYYVLGSAGTLELGARYIVNVDENTIVKAEKLDSNLETYGVRSVSENIISYGGEEDSKTFELPKTVNYYYHGQKTDYETVLEKLELGSSIILTKSNNGSYDYSVIVDPVYSKPAIKDFYNREDFEAMYNDGALFIYRDGEYKYNPNAISEGDVVYTVTDLWGSNKYIYALDIEIDGEVQKLSPNKINPSGITVDGITYSFSKYFDKRNLNDVEIKSYVTLVLDKDGKVIDLYEY